MASSQSALALAECCLLHYSFPASQLLCLNSDYIRFETSANPCGTDTRVSVGKAGRHCFPEMKKCGHSNDTSETWRWSLRSGNTIAPAAGGVLLGECHPQLHLQESPPRGHTLLCFRSEWQEGKQLFLRALRREPHRVPGVPFSSHQPPTEAPASWGQETHSRITVSPAPTVWPEARGQSWFLQLGILF